MPHDLEVVHLHIGGFSEVEEVVQLKPGVVPPMTAGTWVVAVWGCYLFSYISKGSPHSEMHLTFHLLHLLHPPAAPSSSSHLLSLFSLSLTSFTLF